MWLTNFKRTGRASGGHGRLVARSLNPHRAFDRKDLLGPTPSPVAEGLGFGCHRFGAGRRGSRPLTSRVNCSQISNKKATLQLITGEVRFPPGPPPLSRAGLRPPHSGLIPPPSPARRTRRGGGAPNAASTPPDPLLAVGINQASRNRLLLVPTHLRVCVPFSALHFPKLVFN